MPVIFALTIQSPLFRVEIYKSNLHVFHRPVRKLNMKPKK